MFSSSQQVRLIGSVFFFKIYIHGSVTQWLSIKLLADETAAEVQLHVNVCRPSADKLRAASIRTSDVCFTPRLYM